jgi:NAD(P)-dependent dehydrogenase (short-subunit alcohol dehydrogenase family)
VCQCDVSSSREAGEAITTTVANFGAIDILVNNAAWFAPRMPLAQMSDEHWDRNLAVNVTGPFLMSRAAIPVMAHNGGGSIIHVASQMARVANFGQTAYCTAKSALLMLAKGIAVDHVNDNIRCNTLSPGGVATQGMAEVYGSMEAAEREWGEPKHILGRLARVGEIAAGAVFLASDESSFVTGTDLLIDGGYTAI